ncbi:hypothetical protein FIBSPDRAFT_966775 [Athelia psychrophila]|uniref:Transmembrane 9 superfamily member n=1 Tax=Athelia psychrophila TaxID=1759441 RepID=A0A167WFX4_9AGAM|nr:hypothetical protein FIBSPDRAFT_966775 [Fibularhizoctonia sp. CBS 109695]
MSPQDMCPPSHVVTGVRSPTASCSSTPGPPNVTPTHSQNVCGCLLEDSQKGRALGTRKHQPSVHWPPRERQHRQHSAAAARTQSLRAIPPSAFLHMALHIVHTTHPSTFTCKILVKSLLPPKYLRPWAATLINNILPFVAAFVELYFAMTSLFASRAYYAFGFLALTACAVGLTTATVTILFTCFVLCVEKYSACCLLAYGIFCWASRFSLDSMSSVMLYLG